MWAKEMLRKLTRFGSDAHHVKAPHTSCLVLLCLLLIPVWPSEFVVSDELALKTTVICNDCEVISHPHKANERNVKANETDGQNVSALKPLLPFVF